MPQLTQVASGLLFKARVVSVIRGYEKPAFSTFVEIRLKPK